MFFELASTACLVIVLVELTGHIQRRLLPSEYRLLQYLKTSLWTVVVVVEVAIMAHYSVGPEKGVPIFWIMIAGLGVVWYVNLGEIIGIGVDRHIVGSRFSLP